MKINKSIIAICILLILLLTGCIGKTYHVGILACIDYFYPISDGFKEGMTELGYVEGNNIIYSISYSPNEVDEEIEQVLQGFVKDKVNLIVVAPTAASLKAKEVVQDTRIPVVFASAFTDGNDLIDSLRVPGGNTTGVRWLSSAELGVKYLEIFSEMAPQAKRIWVPHEKDYPSMLEQIEAFYSAAEPLGLTIVKVPVQNIKDIQDDMDARRNMDDIGIDAMMLTNSPIASSEGFDLVSEFAAEYRLPIVGNVESTFSYAPEPFKSGKQAAYLADKILKGAAAGTIPVLTVESKLIINYKMANELGLNISEGLMSVADEIIR